MPQDVAGHQKIHDQAARDAQQLGNAGRAAAGHQAVHAKPFDNQPTRTVEQHIPDEQVAGTAAGLAQTAQGNEYAEVPQGFIKERRHVPDLRAALRDQHGHGEKLKRGICDGKSIGLHVEIISPPADTLSQRQSGNDHINQREQIQLAPPRKDERRKEAADQPAIDGQPALPDFQNGNGIFAEQAPRKGHVIQPCADDAAGDQPQGQIDHGILGQTATLFLSLRQQQCG